MKDFDKQDDLWQLLGKAKKNAVSPLFARNVLREIRLSQDSRQEEAEKIGMAGVLSWFRNRWRLVSAVSIAAILLAVGAPRIFVQHQAPAPVAVQTFQPSVDASKPDDTEVITHLDELVAYEENSIWLEDSSN